MILSNVEGLKTLATPKLKQLVDCLMEGVGSENNSFSNLMDDYINCLALLVNFNPSINS